MGNNISGLESTKLFNFEADFPVLYHITWLDNFSVPSTHWHEEFEILQFVEGRAYVFLNDIRLTAEPGDVMYIDPYCLHRLENITDVCKFHTLIVNMDFFINSPFSTSSAPLSLLTKDPLICACMERIIQEIHLKKPWYKTVIQAELLSSLSHLSRKSGISNEKTKNSTNKIRQAIQYIHTHFKEKITVNDICDAVGFSSAYFGRCFHEITGLSMMEFLNKFRCEHAYLLIREGKYSISRCAEMSGFNNFSYFTRRFKRQFGVTPSEIKDIEMARNSAGD